MIVLLTAAAYLPAMRGGFIWDDDAHVTRPELRSFEGLYRIWFDVGATQQYYPLLHTAFWLQHRLWGDSPLGYHMVNLVLHVVVVCLLYWVLRSLAVPGALLAAAVFAVHPVHVESVAWITEQKNTLSAVFYLSAMLAYLRFDDSRQAAYYWLAIGLFVLGLLSKTVTATLPAALMVIFWWQRGTLGWRRDVRPLVPMFVLGAAAGLFTAWVERTLIGAQGAEFELSVVERGLLAGRVVWFYLGKLLWPTNLTFIYPRWQIDAAVWWQWLFPTAALAALVLLWAVRRRTRGPLAAGLLFVGTLFPVLGFLNVYPFLFSFVADHFQYLASIGMIALVSSGMALAAARLPHDSRWLARTLGVVLVSALALLTWRQSHMYADVFTLYRTTIDRNPECWLAYNNLGVELAERNQPQEAIEHHERALAIFPNSAEAHYNLGNALVAVGRPLDAIAHYERALQVRPHYANAHNNLGDVLRDLGRHRQALKHFEAALRFASTDVSAHRNLAIALVSEGRAEQAIVHFERALESQPDDPELRSNLSHALLAVGRPEDAIVQARAALRLDPEHAEAHNNIGAALAQMGRFREAVNHFREAVRLRPSFPHAHANLMAAYAEVGRPREAVAAAETALDQARSAGDMELAGQIDAWLSQYRAEQQKQQANGE